MAGRTIASVYRMLRWGVIVGAAWLAVASLPSVARYLKMRAM